MTSNAAARHANHGGNLGRGSGNLSHLSRLREAGFLLPRSARSFKLRVRSGCRDIQATIGLDAVRHATGVGVTTCGIMASNTARGVMVNKAACANR